jgi:hypothetical protein
VGLKAQHVDLKDFGQSPASLIFISKHRVLPRKQVKRSNRSQRRPINALDRALRCRSVFLEALSPDVPAPDPAVKAGPFHENADRYSLLDVEDVLISRSVRCAFLDVPMQIQNINLIEAAHEGLAHAAKSRIVEPAMVGNDADHAVLNAWN